MPIMKKNAKKKYVSFYWGCNFNDAIGFNTFLWWRKRTLA